MLSYLIHAKDYQKYQYAERSFNNSWRRLPGYLQGQQNQLAKEYCKTEEQKYTS